MLVADRKLRHRLAEGLVAPDPLLLDLRQSLLVALERRLDRLGQRLQLRLGLLVGLAEPRRGAVEELLWRAYEQVAAYLAELGGERGAGLGQLLEPRLERFLALVL